MEQEGVKVKKRTRKEKNKIIFEVKVKKGDKVFSIATEKIFDDSSIQSIIDQSQGMYNRLLKIMSEVL